MCVVAQPDIKLGCDLELIEPRSDAFIGDYFTGEEQQQLARTPEPDRLRLLALLWSGKESALKALQEGLRLDTRCVIVSCENSSCDHHGWSQLHVLYTGGQIFRGWWRQANGMLRTLVAYGSVSGPANSPASTGVLPRPHNHVRLSRRYDFPH